VQAPVPQRGNASIAGANTSSASLAFASQWCTDVALPGAAHTLFIASSDNQSGAAERLGLELLAELWCLGNRC
jgi:hypothetical protein